jgi:hypothetical protein
VVTSQGDTLNGYINYREWNNNPEEFAFKSELTENQSRSFTSQTARHIVIQGYEVYEAHRVAISLDEVANGRLKEGMDTTTTTATVFLKLLLKGNQVNLYLFKDSIKERFYILEKGNISPVELGYKVYLENTNIATSASYKQHLAALAVRQKVFTLTQQIQSAGYVSSHLVKIIAKINGVTDSSISKTLEKAPKTRWFGSTGLNYATFVYEGENELMIDKISGTGFYQFKDQIVTHSYMPRFSAGLDVYLNPAVQRFIIRGELMLAPSKSEVRTHFQHANYSTNSPAQEQLNVYNLSLMTVGATPQIIFNAYNAENLKWYLGAGSALTYRHVMQNKIHLKRTNQEVIISESEKADFYEIRKIGLTMILRSGVTLNKKTDLSVLYSPSTRTNAKSTDSNGPSTLRASSLQLSGAYFFN